MGILLCLRVWEGMMPSWNNIIKLVPYILVLWLIEIPSESFPKLVCNFSPCTINITIINNPSLSTFLEKISNIFDVKDWLNNRVKIAKARLIFEPNLPFFYCFSLWYLLIILKARRYVNTGFIVNSILFKACIATAKSLFF